MAAWPAEFPPPDDDHVSPRADPRFEVGGRVVDAGTFETLQVVDGEPTVAGAGSDDDGSAGDLTAVRQA